MRLLVVMLIVWLFLFYNVERLSDPIDIAGVAYTFLPVMAVLTIMVPRLRQLPLWVLLGAPAPLFLLLKHLAGYQVWGAALPLTVTEICVIAVTTMLARWVSDGVGEFESAINHISIGEVDKLPEPFSTGQAQMYREVRRARNHQRPMALMAVGVEDESLKVALDRMVEEVQQAMMRRYVLSDVARTLCGELEEYNTIAQRNDHFLIMLPEVKSEELNDLVSRLQVAVSEQVGVALRVGSACFPEDAVTFESLLKVAEGKMDGRQPVESSLQPQRLAAEHRTT
jgi:hypothetical protein